MRKCNYIKARFRVMQHAKEICDGCCPYTLVCGLLKSRCHTYREEYRAFETIVSIDEDDYIERFVDYLEWLEMYENSDELSSRESLGIPKPPPIEKRRVEKKEVCKMCPLIKGCSWFRWMCREIKTRYRDGRLT